MSSIDEIYRSPFLGVRDVPAKGLDYPIKRAAVVPMKGKDGQVVQKVVIYSSDPALRPFPLNKGNASDVALVCGSRDFADWPGSIVTLVRRRENVFDHSQIVIRVKVPPELQQVEDEEIELADLPADEIGETPVE